MHEPNHLYKPFLFFFPKRNTNIYKANNQLFLLSLSLFDSAQSSIYSDPKSVNLVL